MMLILLGVAFLVAFIILIQKVRQANKWEVEGNPDHNPRRPRRIGLIALAAMALFGSLFVVNASADDGNGEDTEETTTTTVPPEPDQALFDCPSVDDNPDFYEVQAVDFGHEDDDTARLNSASGEVSLIGNGPPLDADSDQAAAEDLFARTAENPKLTAELAYAFRLEGFTPDQEELEAVNAAPAVFIHQLAANLVVDEELWSQTRADLCLEMAYSRIAGDWKDRDVVQFAARPHTFTVTVGDEDVEFPVRSVVLKRDPRPDGLDLLWMTAYNGDSVSTQIGVAVDMEFAWVTTFGEVPEDLEEFPQSTTTSTTEGETDQTDDTTGNGGGESGSDEGTDCNGCGTGPGGGGDDGCDGCGSGGGGDSGDDCVHDCPGGGDGDDDGGCDNCPPPTNPPTTCPSCGTTTTTRPPTTTATTQPPTTTTTRPPTTTTATTQPPTTTTTAAKDPDPGCPPWAPPGSCG